MKSVEDKKTESLWTWCVRTSDTLGGALYKYARAVELRVREEAWVKWSSGSWARPLRDQQLRYGTPCPFCQSHWHAESKQHADALLRGLGEIGRVFYDEDTALPLSEQKEKTSNGIENLPAHDP